MLSQDVSALKQLAGNSGYHFQLLTAVIEVNELQKRRVVAKLQKHLGSLVGRRVALLGLAFKPHTDDMREASSLVLAARLQADGAKVAAYDPVAEDVARPLLAGVDFAPDALTALTEADACVIVTEWPEFTGPRLERSPCADEWDTGRGWAQLSGPLHGDGRGSCVRRHRKEHSRMTEIDQAPLDREHIAAVDRSGLLEDILALPDQLRDALWRVESAGLGASDATGGMIVAGMGGSAIGGWLARAALGDRAQRPIVLARGYGLPPWTTPESAVLCASYSGNTEETLGAYDAAGAVGARRFVATTGGKLASAARNDGVPVIPLPGGFQPRAAVAYSLVVALEVAALCGAGESLRSEIDVAAAHTEDLIRAWQPGGGEEDVPKDLAQGLHGTIPRSPARV